MLDLKRIREDSQGVALALSRRGVQDATGLIANLVREDEARRDVIGRVNDLKAERNEVSKQVGERKRSGEAANDLIERMRDVGRQISDLDGEIADVEGRIHEALLGLPNLPQDEVQPGGEEANETLREWGEAASFDFDPKPHWELGEQLGILDLPRGAKISGSGFPVLRGAGARLQRILVDFMLDLHTSEHGYEEMRVPYLVKQESMEGTGQLPKFADESYLTERDDLWLIPTAEVPVTNLHRDELLSESDLPIRYTAYTPCFRREAGAAGKDTRGLLRVHQFDKVELVRFETPERSREALEELTAQACKVLELLGLHYRVVRLAAGDLGDSSSLTYDLELWAPGVRQWLEVSSCSTFTDYQARRANLRFRPSGGGKPKFVHTLNGSGVALPRLMVAVIETYQQADGSVRVPEAIRERFGGDRIQP